MTKVCHKCLITEYVYEKDLGQFGLNNILFKVLLTYYDIYIHTIFLGFDGKR